MDRREVDRLVGIWLDDALDARGADAGFANRSMMGRLIDFQGQPPRGSGFYPPDVTMIAAALQQRSKHALWPRIDAVFKRMQRHKPAAASAILAHNCYRGLNPDTDRVYTAADRALILGVTVHVYKHRLAEAYKTFSDEYKNIL